MVRVGHDVKMNRMTRNPMDRSEIRPFGLILFAGFLVIFCTAIKAEEFGSHGVLCQTIHCDEIPKSEIPKCSHCDGIPKSDPMWSCSDLELQKKAAISFTKKYLVGLTTGITLATINTPFIDVITEFRSNDRLDCTATVIGSSTIFVTPNGAPAQGGKARIRYIARKTDEGKLFVEAFDY
jgi:hypothetical protein